MVVIASVYLIQTTDVDQSPEAHFLPAREGRNPDRDHHLRKTNHSATMEPSGQTSPVLIQDEFSCRPVFVDLRNPEVRWKPSHGAARLQ
jgi:hypothetical protein